MSLDSKKRMKFLGGARRSESRILPKSVYDLIPYTRTTIAITNWNLNIESLYYYLPLTEVNPKIKKKDLAVMKFKNGSIISIKIKDSTGKVHIRGLSFKKGCFPNSVCIVIYVNKLI